MKEIQCPQTFEPARFDVSVFIGGGISNCPLWQKDFIALLADEDLVLLNPRRDQLDIANLLFEEDQIKWEYEYMKKATAYVFWFPHETVCPITLFELGAVTAPVGKRVFVGTHPDYSRKRDIRWQMLLRRPEIDVVHSLEKLAGQVREWRQALSWWQNPAYEHE